MQLFRALLVVTPLAALVLAQDTSNPLPDCALSCMTELVPQSTCSTTDQACICANDELQGQLTACVMANCTVRQALTTQNYTATACSWPYRDQSETLRRVSIPLAAVSTVFVALRVTARLPALDGKFGLDDYFIVAAWVLSVGFTICIGLLSESGLGRDVWTLRFEDITTTLKIFTALEKMYIPTVWITKISILLLYLRLFPEPRFRLQVKACLAFCTAALFCLFWACVFKCWPISLSWTYWDREHPGVCTSMAAQGWANSSLNMFADLVVLILPLPTIWKLQLSVEKKLSIMSMFSVGLFVTVVSMVRMKTMKYFTFSTNATWDFVSLSLWSAIEIYVGIMCACMPGMRAFYTRIFRGRKWEKTNASQRYGHYAGGTADQGQKSASDTFSSGGRVSALRNVIRRKDDFELMVTETDAESTEDLTQARKEARSARAG